jgi:ribosomal protein S12 methylthiotransferase accessory factor
VVGRLLDLGLDVLAVDQTTPEHRAGGLAAAKVLVPGLLPMTFGHAHRRLAGLPRLLTVPQRLGYADRPLAAGAVRTLPHPFPSPGPGMTESGRLRTLREPGRGPTKRRSST